MFDHTDSVIGLWPGEGPEVFQSEDDLAYELTCRLLADGPAPVDRQVLPSDFEEILPGPFMAAIVFVLDPERMNGHDVVRLMKARARMASHHEAGKYQTMAQVVYAPPGDPESGVVWSSEEIEHAAVEIAAALTLTRRMSELERDRAVSLTTKLTRVQSLFNAGDLDLPKVKVLEQALDHLPQDLVDSILDRILEDAPGLTTGQLRAAVTRLVLTLDPEGVASAFSEGVADRGIMTYPNPDLTGSFLIHNADPAQITAARAHIEELARSLRVPGETRTLEELRADIALDLLSGKCVHQGGTSRGKVSLVVPMETLAGLSDAPGELEGFGPVIAELARKTAAENINGDWVYTVTDNGRPVATGTLTRRPSSAQKRHLHAVYPTCVMVGCRQPAYQCDLDHRHPFAQGGTTHNHNLEPLCRHHHMVRHHTRWQLHRLPDGDHQWTSPLGHTYIKRRGPPP